MDCHLCLPNQVCIHPTLSHHPVPPIPSSHKHPHQLHASSCSPHPGSGAWGCSTGPDYRCSGSCPPDESRDHIGNPPGLHPELGGPHPSGKLSHFPGSDKTWSRFGLWRDRKIKKREMSWGKPQIEGGGGLQFESRSISLLLQQIRCKKDCQLLFLPQPCNHPHIPKRRRKTHFHCRNPRWSYKHIKWNLFKVSYSGRFSDFQMCG